MNKEQKTAVVEELSSELKDAEAIFAIDYRGISVPQAAELRAGLREADARFRVVKNRLTFLAAEAAGTDGIKDHLTGPTALTLVSGDVAMAAKTLRRLGDEWELLEFKGGIMEGEPLDADSFVAIARLPGRDQLNAQFAGIVASPLTGLVRGLGSMVQGLASQLQQMADQGLVTGEAPAAEEETEEQPEEAAADESAGEEAAEPAVEETPEASEGGEPDPEPSDSPEEEPSEERAPEGESAGEQVPQTGEGDAQPGEAADEAADSGEGEADEAGGEAAEEKKTSEDSENKEDDQ